MPSLNFEYLIAQLYFFVRDLWPSHEAWLNIQLYFSLVWAILGLVFSLILAYLAYLIFNLQSAHRLEMFETLVNTWKNKLDSREPEEWQEIVQALDSENPNDWKLAIIKADTILDGLTVRMDVVGNTLAERLKNIAHGDLRNLDEAWEAHKVRNQIAHDNDYILTKYEARRVIALFERVFKELNYI